MWNHCHSTPASCVVIQTAFRPNVKNVVSNWQTFKTRREAPQVVIMTAAYTECNLVIRWQVIWYLQAAYQRLQSRSKSIHSKNAFPYPQPWGWTQSPASQTFCTLGWGGLQSPRIPPDSSAAENRQKYTFWIRETCWYMLTMNNTQLHSQVSKQKVIMCYLSCISHTYCCVFESQKCMVLVEGDGEQNEDVNRDVLHVQISAYKSIFG